MNELANFERWAARARAEAAPTLDVTDGVLRAIRSPERVMGGSWPLPVFAVLSALAATIVATLAFEAWQIINDPLAGIFLVLQ